MSTVQEAAAHCRSLATLVEHVERKAREAIDALTDVAGSHTEDSGVIRHDLFTRIDALTGVYTTCRRTLGPRLRELDPPLIDLPECHDGAVVEQTVDRYRAALGAVRESLETLRSKTKWPRHAEHAFADQRTREAREQMDRATDPVAVTVAGLDAAVPVAIAQYEGLHAIVRRL